MIRVADFKVLTAGHSPLGKVLVGRRYQFVATDTSRCLEFIIDIIYDDN